MLNKTEKGLFNNGGLAFYSLLLPAMIVTLVFTYLPALQWVIAFTEYKLGAPLFSGQPVGLKYFAEFFSGYGDALPIIRNTVCMNLGSLVLSVLAALLISVFLQTVRSARLRLTILVWVILPYFFSWASIASVVKSLLAYNDGLVNNFLSQVFANYARIDFLGSPAYAWPLMIGLTVWKETGFAVLIFSTAMEQIPQEIYEAADMDGAPAWRKIRSITIPNILNTIAIIVIIEFGWILSSDLDKYYLFTNPTNIPKMEVLDVYIYRYGLKLGRFSYAAAVSVIKNIVSIGLMGLALLFSRSIMTKERLK